MQCRTGRAGETVRVQQNRTDSPEPEAGGWVSESEPTIDVADVLARARSGDQAAWRELVRTYEPRLARASARYRIGDEARDAVQNTFLRLMERGAEIRNPGAVGGWLCATVRNECLQILRRRRRESQQPSEEELWEDLVAPPAGPSMEDQLIRREEADLLRIAMSSLDERQRRLLTMLADPDRHDYAGIGRAMRMPQGSIGPTRQRALRRLRNTLGDMGLRDCA